MTYCKQKLIKITFFYLIKACFLVLRFGRLKLVFKPAEQGESVLE